MMTNDSMFKGVLVGAGGVLLGMYLYNHKKLALAEGCGCGSEGSELADLSSEKLAEIRDSIDDIIAERESKA